ncbi:uncharacterized protein LOC119513410 isoform X2 [Choloepus didactylus]|uniref:uncharacterized protein LOC119513410 isoform X2 n=1 Tax=Choloepus didactylus TaxID=27675 RepID=UPI0018A001C6|nr:uncharacterized protein LOC119513410 isoform X2 [Choloepus didactylus]
MLRRACEPHPVDLPSGGTLGGFHPWATVNAGGDGAAWQQPREEGQKTQQDSRCAAASAEGVVVLGTLETHLPGKPAVRSRRSRRRNGNSKDHTKTAPCRPGSQEDVSRVEEPGTEGHGPCESVHVSVGNRQNHQLGRQISGRWSRGCGQGARGNLPD